MFPYRIETPVDGDWGEVHCNLIDDAATRAEYALYIGGAVYAFHHYREPLEEMIRNKTWRSEAALDVYLRITRRLGEQWNSISISMATKPMQLA